mgnify:CR=1 FL=1
MICSATVTASHFRLSLENWTLVGNFAAAGSSPDANLFAQKYADAFSGKTDALKDACTAIGGEILDSIAGADVTARIPAFSFFPVLLQYWEKMTKNFPPAGAPSLGMISP